MIDADLESLQLQSTMLLPTVTITNWVNAEISCHPLIYSLTYFVEVEWKLPGYRTIQPRFQIGGPVLRENVLSTSVLFANPCNPRVNAFTAVNVFHSGFSEEEQDVVANIERSHKIRLWNVKMWLVT